MNSRKHLQLPLFSENGRWLMRFRGKRVEFPDRRTALRAAILEAFEHSRNGTPTQVVCIDEHLSIEIAWTYGVDPDPPGTPSAPPRESPHRPFGAMPRRPLRRSASAH
ncbi:MAG TPA: hypothetical protein VGG01_11725 [Xanthobacteraceae bacterium]|jgi:hypothetical protein